MGEDRLNVMTILYIEKDIFNQINTDRVKDEFAKNKVRRKFILKNCYFIYFPVSLVELSNATFPPQVKRDLCKLVYRAFELFFINFSIILIIELTFNIFYAKLFEKSKFGV